jgi:hypothetical protein
VQKIITWRKSPHLGYQKLLGILTCQFGKVKLLCSYHCLVLAKEAQQEALLYFGLVLLNGEWPVLALNVFHLSYQKIGILF